MTKISTVGKSNEKLIIIKAKLNIQRHYPKIR
jgi:hypothetical protein